MSSKKKIVAIAITTVALSVGSIGLATASSSNAKSKVTHTKSTTIASGYNVGGTGVGMRNPEQDLQTILSALVVKGTLTQANVDAINAAIAAAKAAAKPPVNANRAAQETLIASLLGISVPTLEADLAAGKSLASIDPTKTAALIAGLVADQTKKIDAAVAANQLTPAQAVTLKANLTASVTAMVNHVGGMGQGRMGEGRMGEGNKGRGMGAPMMGAPALPAPTA